MGRSRKHGDKVTNVCERERAASERETMAGEREKIERGQLVREKREGPMREKTE
jgi:hypothetical protein